jgi:hypothetical protein
MLHSRSIWMFWSAASLLGAAASPRPAGAQISVLSSVVEEHTAGPGERYSGRIAIANPGSTPQTVRLYQTDYRFASDGTSYFDAAGGSARSNALWIALQATQVTVPPKSTVNVGYTVATPLVDSLRGTYWSAIMVEAATKPPIVTPEGSAKGQIGLGTVIRYAIQVATNIGASGTRSVRFAGTGAVQTPSGSSAVEVDVHDIGERGYRPVLWIEVYDEQGVLRAKSKQSRGLLFPGTSLRQHFDLGTLAAGKYKAVIFADTGEDSVYAAQYTVIF